MAWLAETARLDVSDAALESRWLSADAATRERALIVLTASAQRLLEAAEVLEEPHSAGHLPEPLVLLRGETGDDEDGQNGRE